MKHIYIKYDVPGNYVIQEERMEPELFNNLGETYEDYLNNKWVELSEEQVKFHEEHPNASVLEVWNMELTAPYVPTLEEVKLNKINELMAYDQSEAVNSFTINNVVSAWFTASERSNYKSSIEAAKLLQQPSLSFFVGNMMLEIQDISMAEMMLAQIQLYADYCYLVTKQHQVNIMTLETVEEVNNYDYTVNYPEKLNFNLM